MSMLNATLLIFTTFLVIYYIKVNQSRLPINQPLAIDSSTIVQATPTKTENLQQATSQDLLDLQYPGSSRVRFDQEQLFLESNDSPEKVSNWYKEHLNELGLKTTSAIQTSSNGNIFNNYLSSDEKKDIRVEISKSNKDSTTKINLTLYVDNE